MTPSIPGLPVPLCTPARVIRATSALCRARALAAARAGSPTRAARLRRAGRHLTALLEAT